MDKMKRIYFFSWFAALLVNRFKNPRSGTYKRILIIRLDEIGDMMTALPAINYIGEKFPAAEITLWCLPLTAQLVKHHPRISKTIFSKKELSGKYDLIIDMRGNIETASYTLFNQPFFYIERGTVRFKNKFGLPKHPHEVNVNFQVIQSLVGEPPVVIEKKLYLGEENHTAARKFISENKIGPLAILHPFSLKELKEWPRKNFVALADFLKNNYALDIVLIGTKKEEEALKEMQKLVSFNTFLFAGHDLLNLAALCAEAKLFVGNDSGPMHIADAMNIPVVGLFGPGEPHLFSPTGKKAVFIHHKLECNPCDQIHCVHPDNPCMNRITVEEVIEKIKSVKN